jgi:integrase
MAQRRRGDGSVYRTGDGWWCGSVELPAAPGRRRRKVVKSRDEGEVRERMRVLVGDVAAGRPPSQDRTTVGQYLTWWIGHAVEGQVAPETFRKYEQVVRVHLVPRLGRLRLRGRGGLTSDHVTGMMEDMRREGLRPNSVAVVRAVLRRALADALAAETVDYNAAARARRPRGAGAPRLDDRLDEADALAVVRHLDGDRWAVAAVLGLFCGLRSGEVVGLRWPDVHLDEGWATVTGKGGKVRQVPLPAAVVAVMRAHRQAQRVERMAARTWVDLDLVLTMAAGTPVYPRELLRWWVKVTTTVGLGPRRFHAARHSAATIMLSHNVPMEVISKNLGHASLAVTAGVYAEVLPKLQREAADVMDEVMRGVL